MSHDDESITGRCVDARARGRSADAELQELHRRIDEEAVSTLGRRGVGLELLA